MSDQEQIDWSIFDDLTVDCQLTEKEAAAGNKLNWRSKFKAGRVLIAYICYVALLAIVMFLVDPRVTFFDLWTMAAAVLGVMIFTLCVIRVAGQRRAKAYFRRMPSSHRPARFGWDTNGLYAANATSRAFHPWSDFMSWSEDKTVLALLFAGPIFIPLPKHALTDQQLADLKAHIEASALPKARLFPI